MTGYKAYQGNQIDGAGPLGLILLTYDVLYKSLGRARMGIERADLVMEAEQTSRAIEALLELTTSLDMQQGGKVAESLSSLYAYMINRLSSTLCTGSTAAVDEVMPLVQTLREGWYGLQLEQKKLNAPAMRSQAVGGARRPVAAYAR
ncbi:MAG: flagellar export chaperone FliS [Zetaproteobacteria bacterium CG_4_9_14_3_um_filter_53_7]|nr:MAG: flagellar export chaperone FliS [Zetaproteobacteria bacterium CG_4_9_14_3_um_filter_53_7]